MWRVKFWAVLSQNCGILRCSAWVSFSNWIWNQGPKYIRARKPNPARQTNLKPIRHGLRKVLLNVNVIKKAFVCYEKQYIQRITITTINHLQDGICHHGCCRCPGAKQAPDHQQQPCCKYRLFTRFHWKLICEDNTFPTRTFYRGVPGFATDCPCGVWCRGLNTCLHYVGSFFGNLV